MTQSTIYWYDYETFGADPRRDRAAQFAGLRTNEALEPVEDPLVLYCRPADDFLPAPEACLITGITPQVAAARGVTEMEFIAAIHQQFTRPSTCVAGYNSIRFDDELTRQLLYRNFYDPYEREWKNGNSRWDIIDMLRLCAAVRPEGIQWPRNEEGHVTFRLEKLTAANGITHSDAHDALADVRATIAMAQLVRQNQRRLYDYVFNLRAKQQVEAQLDISERRPVLHVSSRYPASQGCLALVSPLCRHPADSNGVIVCDLRMPPAQWVDLSVEEIRERVFQRGDSLPLERPRIPLKVIHTNRCPIVAPVATLEAAVAAQFGVDLNASQTHWEQLRDNRSLADKLKKVFAPQPGLAESDPDFMIYSGGFFSDGDRRFMQVVRGSSPEQLAKMNIPFKDARLAELLFRYRARNFPQTLDLAEQQRWQQFRQSRLGCPSVQGDWRQSLQAARAATASARDQMILDDLAQYADTLLADITLLQDGDPGGCRTQAKSLQ